MKRGHFIVTAAIVDVIMGTGIIAAVMTFSSRQDQAADITYHEIRAQYGMMASGITRTAPISLGVAEQTLDLDIGTVTGEIPAALEVGEVLVSPGQQVQKGTALFRVTSDSVQRVRAGLQKEILDTNRTCEVIEAKQKELHLQASQGYDSDIIDGKYAAMTYNSKCGELQKKADDAKEAVDQKQNQINQNLLELTQAQEELVKAQKYLKEAEAAVSDTYDNRYRDSYYYTVYGNTREKAQNMVAQSEEEIENLTRKNETLLYEVDEAVRAYHQIVQDLEKEKLTAGMEREVDIYGSQMASERYEIQTASLDNALQEAEERYQDALRDIRQFDACIVRDCVLSEYSGVLSAVPVEAGDTLGKNDTLVTLYDQENASITVTLRGEEYHAVDPGRAVNISFTEYPDKVYEGRIADSFAAKSDSQGDAYTVKVVIQGDTADLGMGMTGDVTFLTDETKRVLYVPKRAVFMDGERSYVKMRGRNGTIVEKNVTTGLSDGIHIEIIKGISEGDVVLLAVK